MRAWTWLAALAVVASAPAARAQGEADQQAVANAVASLLMVDVLRERCPASGQSPLAGQISAWERATRAAELRRAIDAERAKPGGERQYGVLRDSVVQMVTPFAGRECEGLTRFLGAQSGAGRASAASAAASPPAARPATTTAAAPPAAARGDIQGYGLITQYGLGYGGMVTFKFEPVVLYRSGELLKDLKGLANPAGAAADRQANPKRWTRWRQAGGVYEYAQTDGKWGKIYNNKVWATPPVANLRGRYVTTGGGGNTAMGGNDAVFVQAAYDFHPGGRLVRDGFAEASSSVEGGGSRTRTVTGARQGARAGRYTIDGLFMSIAYDDGGRERVTFMTHPSDPGIIWINGTDYIRR